MKKQLISWMATWPFWLKNIVYTVWLKTTRAGKVANERERLVVSTWDEAVSCGEFYHVMHAHRYWWAKQLIDEGSTTLDLGSGSGYGAWYLATGSAYVLGFDPDENAVSWAIDHFETGELYLSYRTKLEVDEIFSHIICFEVLEHDPEAVLETILTHLTEGGTLIISTPNAEPASVRTWLLEKNKVKMNHTHKQEFTRQELKKLLIPHFESVELFGQCAKDVRNFYDYGEWRRKRGVKLDDFTMSETDYVNCEVIVALCKGFKGVKK